MRIFYVGDSPTVDTGFGVVSKNLISRFYNMGYEIIVLGINHRGEPYDPKLFPYPIHPTAGSNLDSMYGYSKFWDLYDHLKPDIVFFLNDPWVISQYLDTKPQDHPGISRGTKTVGYYPTDAGPIKKEWVDTLNKLDAQVCYSNYAEGVVIESNGGKRPSNLHQIYHGVNRDEFFPVNQSIARAMLKIDQNEFVVGMVARNQFRKRFDLLLKAFQIFAKGKPEARLYLHTAMFDVGFDISELIRQLKLDKKVYVTKELRSDKGVPVKDLNIIYNTFDVNALISLGDGFGLPVAESMATGCPQVVSGHSCLKELVEGHGGLTVKTSAWILNTSGINTWGGVSDVDDIVAQLEVLYKNRELRIRMSEEGYKFISQEKFTWDFAANKFQEIFKNLFHLIN
jgi:glycosyltransferase involved in cell wall biosynthesis